MRLQVILSVIYGALIKSDTIYGVTSSMRPRRAAVKLDRPEVASPARAPGGETSQPVQQQGAATIAGITVRVHRAPTADQRYRSPWTGVRAARRWVAGCCAHARAIS
jgi:hypothetical protein